MRPLYGIAMDFWAAASLYFAYGSYYVAAVYQRMGWSYVEYPLRQAFGEHNQTSEVSQKMWAQAIQNARAFDPRVEETQIALAQWIADPLIQSASKQNRMGSALWAANAVISFIAGAFLIWRRDEHSRSPKAAS